MSAVELPREHNPTHIEDTGSLHHWEFLGTMESFHPEPQCKLYCRPSSKRLELFELDETNPIGKEKSVSDKKRRPDY